MSNFHSSWTSSTPFKYTYLNPPIADLDQAITLNRTAINCCLQGLSWDGTTGTLAWTAPAKFVHADPDDGKMIVNLMASGSITIPANNIAYIDLSTVQNSTVSATYVEFSTASTALIGDHRVILGAVNTALEFYFAHLHPSLGQVLNSASTVISIHGINSTAAHSGTATENDIFVASSAGLPAASGRNLTQFLGARESTMTSSASITVDFTNAETFIIDLTTDTTVTISTAGIYDGNVYRIRFRQDATGGWAVSWSTVSKIAWRGSSAPTITTGAEISDVITLLRSDGTWFADVAANFPS